MDNFTKRHRKEMAAVAAGRDHKDFLAMAETSPEAAAGVHRMLTKFDSLLPRSTVMQGLLTKLDAIRRA